MAEEAEAADNIGGSAECPQRRTGRRGAYEIRLSDGHGQERGGRLSHGLLCCHGLSHAIMVRG